MGNDKTQLSRFGSNRHADTEITKANIIPFNSFFKRQIEASSGFQASSQLSLFPYYDNKLVVLINIDAINGTQLLDLVDKADPSVVFDLRPCPRFDLAGMNRSIFLKKLEKNKIKYYDLAGANGIQTSDDPKLHPMKAAELISKKLSLLKIDRPIFVFLTNSTQVSNYSITFPTTLQPIPENGWHILDYAKLT